MTLDEAIISAKEVSEIHRRIANIECEDGIDDDIKMNCLNYAEEHEQLAVWLEDYKRLKSIPEHAYENCHNLTCRRKSEKDGYDKAIDDFVNKISESNQGHWRVTRYEHGEAVSETMSYDIGTIKLIAEQLKGGE